ncbi:MAG: hypothetical protein ACKOEI_01940, partial [Chthoniobacterales bacterium]
MRSTMTGKTTATTSGMVGTPWRLSCVKLRGISLSPLMRNIKPMSAGTALLAWAVLSLPHGLKDAMLERKDDILRFTAEH